MDFPLFLESASTLDPTTSTRTWSEVEFVYGEVELKQCIYLLLKTSVGSFLQSPTLGNDISVHVSDSDMLTIRLKKVLQGIEGLTVRSIVVEGTNLYVSVTYRGNFQEFVYSVNSFE